jgi:hypothetical protein
MQQIFVGRSTYSRINDCRILHAAGCSEDAASKRLLKNQEDIGNAIVPYYGAAAGTKLTDLLKQPILIAVDLKQFPSKVK